MEHVTKESFRVWLDPLKKKYQGVVESVVNSCDNPHLRVIADERVKRAFYVSPIGKNVKVLLDKNVDSENQDPFNRDYFPSSSPSVFLELDNDDMVVLHEIGHALGLADTYLEHASGCKEGQPISKMCDSHAGGFGLWEDDYNGILAAADRAFPGRSPEKNCQAESFRNQSHHSYVDFNLPTMVAGSYIDIKEGQYNNYVFPKCNRVWWTDLTFTCIDGSWTRTRGDWNADGLCHGSAEGGRYHTFGNL
jgi:hypothetical protein